jgi:hypothetical protein
LQARAHFAAAQVGLGCLRRRARFVDDEPVALRRLSSASAHRVAFVNLNREVACGEEETLFERFAQVGNAAEIAARCRDVEFNTHPPFQKRFMKNIGFAEDVGAQGDAP